MKHHLIHQCWFIFVKEWINADLESERIRNSIEGKFGEPVRWGGSPTCSLFDVRVACPEGTQSFPQGKRSRRVATGVGRKPFSQSTRRDRVKEDLALIGWWLNCLILLKLRLAIAITFLVMNLSTHLSRLFYAFLYLFFNNRRFSQFQII